MTTFQPNWAPIDMIFRPETPELEPASEPGEQTGPITTAEQQSMQTILDAKAEAAQFYDRQQAEFDARIAQHKAAIEQQLRSDVPPALFTAVDEKHQALLGARRTAAQARQALSQHEAARPHLAADVPAWAKRKGELADELIAYDSIAADADAAYQQAQGRVQQALQQAFLKRLGDAQAAYDTRNAAVAREFQARMTALNEWRASAQKELEQLGERIGYWQRYT